MKRKLIPMFLAFALLFLLPQLTLTAHAASSGSCGDSLKWSYSSGTLSISGTGKMYDYSTYSSVPWASYRTSIKTVSIGADVISIGDNAFGFCSNLTTVTVRSGSSAKVTSIGDFAFQYCTALTTIKDIPTSLREVGSYAFRGCSAIRSVNFLGTSSLWNKVVTVRTDNSYLTQYMGYGSATHPNHPICGLTCTCEDTLHNPLTWTAWDGKSSTYNSSRYYLTSNVTRTSDYTFSGSGTGTICLNDHTINTQGNAVGFYVASGTGLRITDCGTKGTLTSVDSYPDSFSSDEIAIYNEGSFYLYNGTLRAGDVAVFTEEGASTYVYGGKAEGDSGIQNYGAVTLNGGTIIGLGGDSIWTTSSASASIDGASFQGTLSNNGTTNIYSGSMSISDSWSRPAIQNVGTMTIHDANIHIPQGFSSNAVEAIAGTLHILGGKFPASTYTSGSYTSQYYGLYVDGSSTRVYISGSPQIGAICVRYPNRLSFVSADGLTPFTPTEELLFYVSTYNFGSNGIAAYNVSTNTWEKITQINSDGTPGNKEGTLYYADGNVAFAKVIASGKCGDNLNWSLDGNGRLTISGTGSMYNYTNSTQPWNNYRNQIKHLIISDGCTYLGNEAFFDCTNLQSIDFGNGSMTMGNYCFANCSSLTEVNIPAGVQLGYAAFHWCTGLQKATVACPELSKYAFELCTSLNSLILEEGVTTVTEYALRRTDSLKEITFPASVKTIDQCIFNNNSNTSPSLRKITFLGADTQIDADFLRYMPLSSITVYGPECSTAGQYTRNLACTFVALPNSNGHTPKPIAAISPTCTDTGLTEGSKCSICDLILKEQTTVSSLGHSFINYIPNEIYPCTENGLQTAQCERCEATHTKPYTPGHTFTQYTYNNDATCIAIGTQTATCNFCDATDTKDAPGTVGDHSWSVWSTSAEPTCTQAGQSKRSCSLCTAVETKAISALEHDYAATITDPTCTTDGFTTYDCTRCTASYISDELPAKGHNFLSYTTIVTPDCTSDEVIQAKCESCEELDTVTVPDTALGHSEVVDKATAPSCTEPGLTEGSHCSACNTVFVAQKVISANGHSEVFDKAIAPTWTEPGLTEGSHCSTCNEVLVKQTEISKMNHNFSKWILKKEPTVSEEGLEVRTCSRCGATEKNILPKLKPEVSSLPFVDVSETEFFYKPVQWAVQNGITSGTSATTFSPNDNCTRAHVVTFLWRVAGSPEPTSFSHPFVDLKENEFYYKAVLWAVENGITNGTSNTTFTPNDPCTRGQIVTFLYRFSNTPAISGNANPFSDVEQGTFYYTPVLWAVENGITNGTSATTFAPDSICTRGQVVTFLYRAIN